MLRKAEDNMPRQFEVTLKLECWAESVEEAVEKFKDRYQRHKPRKWFCLYEVIDKGLPIDENPVIWDDLIELQRKVKEVT